MFAATGLLPRGNAMDDRAIHDYLVGHPQILAEMTNSLSALEAADADRAQKAALAAIGMKTFFDPRRAFVTGPTSAKMTLVEFFDYNCPYCRASVPALKKYYDAHKNDTRFSFIEFPIKGTGIDGGGARGAGGAQPARQISRLSLRADERGKGLVTEDIVYARRTQYADARKAGLDVDRLKADMKSKDIDAAIAWAHKLATRAKIDGTPTFIVNASSAPARWTSTRSTP